MPRPLSFSFALLVLISLVTPLIGQEPVYISDFSRLDGTAAPETPWATVLDLSPAARDRSVRIIDNPLSQNTRHFSIVVWAQGDTAFHGEHLILAIADGTGKKAAPAWMLGSQTNGSWFWQTAAQYNYAPTPGRQPLCDGQWHQLAATYNAEKTELRLYHDGRNMAIYHAPNLKLPTGRHLFLGGRPSGDLNEESSFVGRIGQIRLYDTVISPSAIRQDFQSVRRTSPSEEPAKPASAKTISVMSWNIWHGGREIGTTVGVQRVVDVIRQASPDLVAMQETYGSGPQIADALGYYFYLRSSNLSILSRYPIGDIADGGTPFNNGGAFIEIAPGRRVLCYVTWLPFAGDYWATLAKGETVTPEAWKKQHARNDGVLADIFTKIRPSLEKARGEKIPVFFSGDFNSGSHLDWVETTQHLNGGNVILFPSSQRMLREGFQDSFRTLHPNPLPERGITWSPMATHPLKQKDMSYQHRDRIDYVYFSGPVRPVSSRVIDTHPVSFPSDHAAVLSVFEMTD